MIAIVFAIATAVIPQQYVTGHTLPSIQLVDDGGREQSIDAWKGMPTILVPMYTRCPTSCPMITEALKAAAANSKVDPTTYRVVLFSFDPRDSVSDLRSYREHHGVPLAWTMATARPADVRRLLDALDVRVTAADGTILHPNVAIALTPELKTATVFNGTSFSARDIDRALSAARGGNDWIGRFGSYALAFLLIACIVSVIYAGSLFESMGKSAITEP